MSINLNKASDLKSKLEEIGYECYFSSGSNFMIVQSGKSFYFTVEEVKALISFKKEIDLTKFEVTQWSKK